jgi:glycosyltransferase involved in cell wall biosynthesis
MRTVPHKPINLGNYPSNMRDLVSVVIPCYKQAGFLAEAIESVLAQTHPHVEIMVVDDGSPDNASDVALSYPGVRCIRQENQGLSAARNTGIRESKGQFLVFLDADDRLTPDALRRGLDHLRQFPDAAFVAGRHRNISIDGSPLSTRQRRHVDKDYYVELLQVNHIGCPAAVMYRRSVFDEVGGFDTTVNPASDYDLYLRIAQKFAVSFHTDLVAEYRKHGDSMSNNHQLMSNHIARVLQSQLKQVSGNGRYEEACLKGIRFYEHLFRITMIIDRMRSSARKENWRGALWNVLLLLWSDPRAFGEELRRKGRLVILRRRRSSRWMPREEAR